MMCHEQRQHLLSFLGYYHGAVDGIWGPKSRKGMLEFQKTVGLQEAAGETGKESDRALLKAVGEWKPEDSWWEAMTFFQREEFRCTCGGRGCDGFPAEPRERLVRNAQEARCHFGKAALVSSGVRCQLRNRELPGSATNSLHLKGRAMDFCVLGIGSAELLEYVRTLPEVVEAYAIDGSYVHMGIG